MIWVAKVGNLRIWEFGLNFIWGYCSFFKKRCNFAVALQIYTQNQYTYDLQNNRTEIVFAFRKVSCNKHYRSETIRQNNIGNLNTFIRFVKLCAGRIGNVLNISSLANDADISVNTAKSWLSVLEASYIIFMVQPYTPNINRRLIKSPKLYFYDTGLVCALLNIEQENLIENFYLRGNLFENFIFSELVKNRYNKGLPANFYYLRDAKGVEVDVVIEKPDKHVFIEIKLSETLLPAHLKNIELLQKEFSNTESFLIYSGTTEPVFHNTQCVNWKNMDMFF
jgi:predicted AAA+ superfamily ATPase